MSRIIIFGCGGIGVCAMQKLTAEGNEIVCFVDNSRRKWNTCCEGKRVIAPSQIVQEQFDYVAIGLYKAVDTIKAQLRELGIGEAQMIVPLEPNRIFPSTLQYSRESLTQLPLEEYTAKTTKGYIAQNIQIDDQIYLNNLEHLKQKLIQNNIPREKVCVVSGAVLQAFGLRKTKEFDDIDIIMTDDLRELYGTGLVIVSETVEMHVKDEYPVSDDEIVRNREHHFVFQDLKFMHPSVLYEYGKRKNSKEYEALKHYCNLGID